MSPDQNKELDGVALELLCLCGSENFERVVVERRPHAAVVTDFVACVGCRAMYLAPLSRASLVQARSTPGSFGVGGPQPDYRGPLIQRVDPPPRLRTPEEEVEYRQIMEAVARANKSKHKGRRG